MMTMEGNPVKNVRKFPQKIATIAVVTSLISALVSDLLQMLDESRKRSTLFNCIVG
jgi:exonuclease VII large subunit